MKNHESSKNNAAETFSIMKKKLTVGILSILASLLISCIIIVRTTIGNLLRGHVHFQEKNVGDVLTMEDGQKFTVFRRLKVDGKGDNTDNLAVFKVRFKFKNLSTGANKRLSIIPAPFLMGMKGFQEKIWTINKSTNDFQGIYQWSSKEAAMRYPDTFIFKLMTKRAAPGTISYEIMPNTDLVEYISNKSL
jgi:hypothetical protein